MTYCQRNVIGHSGREAREYVQSWSPANMAEKLGEPYRAVVEGLPLPEDTSRIDSGERLTQTKRL
jgi:hypothetical protein